MDVSETPTLPPAGSAKQSAAATAAVATATNDHGHGMAKGSFHNYADQLLPKFDPLPASSGQL